MDETYQQQMLDRLGKGPWFPIADHVTFTDKFERKGQKLGGHTVPSHGYLFV